MSLRLTTNPSLTISKNAEAYYTLIFEEESTVPGVASFLTELSYLDYNSASTESEDFGIARSAKAFCYIPVGIDLSLGSSSFWKRSHLFYEGQVGFPLADVYRANEIRKVEFRHRLGFRFLL